MTAPKGSGIIAMQVGGVKAFVPKARGAGP